jgi:hypothetical protein
MVDGKMVPLDERPFFKGSDDFLTFFEISSEHFNKINCVLLEGAYKTFWIIFKSQLSARKALESYLTLDGSHGFKVVGKQRHDPRLTHLKFGERCKKVGWRPSV